MLTFLTRGQQFFWDVPPETVDTRAFPLITNWWRRRWLTGCPPSSLQAMITPETIHLFQDCWRGACVLEHSTHHLMVRVSQVSMNQSNLIHIYSVCVFFHNGVLFMKCSQDLETCCSSPWSTVLSNWFHRRLSPIVLFLIASLRTQPLSFAKRKSAHQVWNIPPH